MPFTTEAAEQQVEATCGVHIGSPDSCWCVPVIVSVTVRDRDFPLIVESRLASPGAIVAGLMASGVAMAHFSPALPLLCSARNLCPALERICKACCSV